MKPEDLADEIIARLNDIIQSPMIRHDVAKLIEARVECTSVTVDHPTIQTHVPPTTPEGRAHGGQLGFLGLLNGIVGTIPAGEEREGWGYIAAEFDDVTGHLIRFVRTDTRNPRKVG